MRFPTFDRAAIMSLAWKLYRKTYSMLPYFDRACFRSALREAWRRAREAMRVAAIPAAQKIARIAAIRSEIEMLSYKPLQINTFPIRRKLEIELSALSA